MSRSRKILWTLAVLVVGYIGLSSLPSGTEMLSGARDTESQIDEVRKRIARANDAAGDLDTFTSQLDVARRAVPVEPELPAVIDALDGAVRAAGMRWISGSPSAADSDESNWKMSLTLTGSSRDVGRLLDNIRALDRLVVIDSVQVRGDRDATILLALRFFAAQGDPKSFPVNDQQATGQEG
jgi:Tfp pilus assembly protein PilO